MKVILQQDVKGQGKKGQMVDVSDGYARNFLLPRKLAVEATAENVNTMKMQDKARKAREAEEKAQYGLDVNKSKLVLPEPLKAFGSYQVKCKLGYEITGTVYVLVVEG